MQTAFTCCFCKQWFVLWISDVTTALPFRPGSVPTNEVWTRQKNNNKTVTTNYFLLVGRHPSLASCFDIGFTQRTPLSNFSKESHRVFWTFNVASVAYSWVPSQKSYPWWIMISVDILISRVPLQPRGFWHQCSRLDNHSKAHSLDSNLQQLFPRQPGTSFGYSSAWISSDETTRCERDANSCSHIGDFFAGTETLCGPQ